MSRDKSMVRVGVLSPTYVKEKRFPAREGRKPLSFVEAYEFVQDRMDLLRQTADELQAGTINRWHAANRIRRIAGEIAKAKTNPK
jgi:hypothetical protein